MPMIVTEIAHDVYGLRDAFIAANRDYFPLPVYEYLFDYLNETAARIR